MQDSRKVHRSKGDPMVNLAQVTVLRIATLLFVSQMATMFRFIRVIAVNRKDSVRSVRVHPADLPAEHRVSVGDPVKFLHSSVGDHNSHPADIPAHLTLRQERFHVHSVHSQYMWLPSAVPDHNFVLSDCGGGDGRGNTV